MVLEPFIQNIRRDIELELIELTMKKVIGLRHAEIFMDKETLLGITSRCEIIL